MLLPVRLSGTGTRPRAELPRAAAEGGFGPDLAGRKLSVARVTRAVRQPWGIMPMFKDTQLGYTDKGLADFVAYFDSLPAPAQPGKPRYELPATGATPDWSQ
jgi:hypothetical protein